MLVLRWGRRVRRHNEAVPAGRAAGNRSSRAWWPLTLAAIVVLAGCASTPPSSFYTLTPLPQTANRGGDLAAGSIAVGLGPVSFPQFLDRPQIVTRDGDNRLIVNEFHRWGGSVQDDFLRVWGENLSYLLGTTQVVLFPSESRMALDYRVPVEVLAFEGTADGSAVLRARWSVTDERLRRTYAARESAYRCPVRGLAAAGDATAANVHYAAVVAALSACLGDFSREVAAVLGALPKPQPPAPPQKVPEPPEPPQPLPAR